MPVLLRWQVGTVGTVCELRFNSFNGWQVLVEHEKAPSSMSPEEIWPEIDLLDFLGCCVPLEPPTGPDVLKEASNDR